MRSRKNRGRGNQGRKQHIDNPDTLEDEIKDNPNVSEMTIIKISEAVADEVAEFSGEIPIQKDEDGIYRLQAEVEEEEEEPEIDE